MVRDMLKPLQVALYARVSTSDRGQDPEKNQLVVKFRRKSPREMAEMRADRPTQRVPSVGFYPLVDRF
jgi:hypothetical protein